MPTSTTSRTAASILLVVALLGTILSGAGLYSHTASVVSGGTHESFCNLAEHLNCDKVNASEWASLFGIPIAAYGLVFYGLLFYLSFSFLALGSAVVADSLFVFTGASVLYSVFLFIISKFFIGTLCLVCIGLYAVSLVSFACSFFLGKERPVTTRLVSGVSSILLFPRNFFRFKGAAAVVSTIGLIFCACLAFGTTTLISYFEGVVRSKLSAVNKAEAPSRREESSLYEQWKGEKEVTFSLSEEEGVGQDFAHGPADAPVQIVEFSDLECPACSHAYEVLEELVARYPGKIRLVYKHFPLDISCNPSLSRSIHESACLAAAIAQCGGAQGKFWETVDVLFDWDYPAAPPSEKERIDLMLSDVASAGVDPSKARQCLEAGAAIEKVKRDVALGQQLVIRGTPTIWVNGKRLPRFNKDLLEQLVGDLIAQAGST